MKIKSARYGGDGSRRVPGTWGAVLLAVGLAMSLLVIGAAQAHADFGDAPTWPVTGPVVGPPPVPMMPSAGATPPPTDVIADPITAGAVCGGWHLQSRYGDRWPGASTWWEYQCTYHVESVIDAPCEGQCNAFCYVGMFSCGSTYIEDRTDYFVSTNGLNGVFYGQVHWWAVDDNGSYFQSESSWWDAPTTRWYTVVDSRPLTVSKQGAGSGTVSSNPGGLSCGETCQAPFRKDIVVTLTASPDPTSTFAGWGGDCSGTGPCQVAMDQARSVTATFAVADTRPTAAFDVYCEALTCSLNASASKPVAGSIVEYRWDFGDDATGTGQTTEHSYATAGSYPVNLSVTDDRGSVGTITERISVSGEASPAWNVATDFAVEPNQANPNPDRFGNPNVWRFLHGTSLAHDPGTYRRLPNFIPDRFGVEGLQTWQGTVISIDEKDRLPSVSINTRSDNPYPYEIDWPAGAVLVHPLNNQIAAVGWRSPFSGVVQVTGRVADVQRACGDGIDWSVDKGGATLASGSILNAGAKSFSAASGSTNLESVGVGVGDVLYFVVGPGPSGDHRCDSTRLDVTIRPVSTVPNIDSFTPTSGAMGARVEIVGANFTGASSVTFNGTNTTYTVDSDSRIQAIVPASATTGQISVTTPNGVATSPSSFTVIPPPTITGFSPTAGAVGTRVEIRGQDLNGATSVTFNGTAANLTVVSPTLITAPVPIGATTGAISVTTPSGTATSSTSFTVMPRPTITGFSPTGGPAGRPVTITGSNLTKVTTVKLGTTSAKFTLSSPTELKSLVPTIARGYYRWSVTTPAGTATSTGSFRVR
jgi:hypothetical protein